MAFDGFLTAALAAEFQQILADGRVNKVTQPERDAIVLTVRTQTGQRRLLLSCSPALPLACLTERDFVSPASAPAFCMLLRKHLTGGRIQRIEQPSLERILRIVISHRNELGDIEENTLILEIMGKHSNLIFVRQDGAIIDAMRRVPGNVSSLREVLPGRPYFLPESLEKLDPLAETREGFIAVLSGARDLRFALMSYAGMSTQAAEELCFRADLESARPGNALSPEEVDRLAGVFLAAASDVRAGIFHSAMQLERGVPAGLSALHMTAFLAAPDRSERPFASPSALLETYYAEKDETARIRQRSADLRHLAETAQSRVVRKLDLQRKQMADTESREKDRLRGELLTAYAHEVPAGASSVTLNDYNTGKDVTIPLDPTLSANENAARFFARYQKQKRTFDALTQQLAESEAQAEHLDSILTSLSLAETEQDLKEIREELVASGYAKRTASGKKEKALKPRPLSFKTSDGFELLVGKNNLQNEEVTFRLSSPSDWWFHAKGVPGSHVILRSAGREVSDAAMEEAAALAAWFSKLRGSAKADVDYVLRKEVKKVPGARPGYVIYHTNYSMTVTPGLPGREEPKT
ncbi:MAG: NFACT family protein [Lachnospiraceae bacterium]|nr:NFACT family protein [Lachnospiraceae bacterium]